MQIYGANVKFMRYIPGVVDGLKPGERRIMYGMYLKKLFPDRNHKKSSVAISEAILLHPHGDGPIYDTIVKLAQPWNNNQVLIDGQGGFGTPMGEAAAASRYTEVRMSLYAYKCFFEEFDLRYSDTRLNYLGDTEEPEFLHSRYPNVLINNTFGIGYGVSTGLPTYNTKEVLELTIKLLEDPDYEDVTLIPDSPTYAHIVDEGQFKELSETGIGQFKMRGEMEVDEENNIIIIKSVPLQVSPNKVKEAIIALQNEGKISGILDFKESSARETNNPSGFEMRIILKKEADPYAIMDALYTSNKVRMQVTIPINFKLIDDYEDKSFNVRSVILTWLDYRRDFKRRVYNHMYIKAKERQHILDTLLMIFTGKNAEKALETIRNAESKSEIREYLMKTFNISSLQAEEIAEMKLSAFTKESIKRYKAEKEEIDKKVESYKKIIKSNKKIDKIIKEELEEGIRLFGGERKSQIITIDGTKKIRDTKHLVVVTKDNMIKKLPHDVETIGHINQGDYPTEILTDVSNLTDILFFDSRGMISKLSLHEIPNTELSSGGENISKFCNLTGRITSIIRKPTLESIDVIKAPIYLLMVTKNGIIKKTLLKSYMNIKSDLMAMIIKEGDELQSVKMLAGTKDILVYTNKGFGIRFSSETVKETNRMSIGVKAIELTEDEVVIGMDIVNEKDTSIFALTNKGTGKRSTLENFPPMDRGGKSLRIISLENDEEVIIMKTVKGKEKFKVFLKNSIEEI
ncbi:MAG TPA: DNA topoisomerase (ATP-hydrolyzing) subunit A, partial [Acholeplasma sp.]